MAKALAILALMLSVLCCACTVAPRNEPPQRILFVGNSLTYYNDLPAKFAVLYSLSRSGHRAEVEMLATAGASLRDRLDDGSLARALAQHDYDIVVLQDFGGWPLCSSSIPACAPSAQSLKDSVALVRGTGARPFWFATWIALPSGQRSLSAADADIGREIGTDYADVGAAIQEAMPAIPDLLQADGHPASISTWLAAATLLKGMYPDANLPFAPPRGCGRRWQGAGLQGSLLASQQSRPPVECGGPAPAQWTAIRSVAGAL